MIKFLIYGINFYPELVGIGKYSGELAFWLSSKGYEIRVITATKYFPDWRVKENSYKKEFINNVLIKRCPLWVPMNPSGLKRIMHLFSFSITSFIPFIKECFSKPNVIFVVAPSIACAPIALISKLISPKSLLMLHIQDFEIDAAFSLKILKGNQIKKLLTYLEKIIYQNFDLISTLNLKMLEKCISKGVPKDKLFIFPNWIDTRVALTKKEKLLSNNKIRKDLNIKQDDIILMYSGSMSKKQGLEELIEVIKNFEEKNNIKWILSGQGPLKNKLIKKTKNMRNVLVFNLRKASEIKKWLNIADIHLIPQKSEVKDLVMPSKLLGIMASGKPFITNADSNSELGEIANAVGMRTEPNNKESFKEGLLDLISDEVLRKKLGLKGIKFVQKNYEKDYILKNFEKKIKSNLKNN
ncbi:WcaI family glycosyltransferase [Prochlorococcus marinus]|uniref:Glycosyl transferase n=1 Tax=Prochlorococcus marinus str. MIT 9401 TaxID=167551 RepID=A0A0A2BD10_PROMR|nr:WcaI family glycosyltransferase [Prochlorococcus marinus]KGG05485.1 glycosyl transferase [Prochlorococcus marinus str. MIT 9322]KGG10519.1 glycosyl transferase [Prochlorococcus marinus str. MIT 9401]